MNISFSFEVGVLIDEFVWLKKLKIKSLTGEREISFVGSLLYLTGSSNSVHRSEIRIYTLFYYLRHPKTIK
jgi:hypothetical protein